MVRVEYCWISFYDSASLSAEYKILSMLEESPDEFVVISCGYP